MGIHKLTGFIDNHFTKWQRKELRGRLVIDGYNIGFHLNRCDWSHGGQFREYRERVMSFYGDLKRSGVVPIVVLDGVDYTGQKWPTIIRREGDRIRQLHRELNKPDRRADIRSQGIFPALGSEVYVQALMDLGVEYVFADGEADEAQVEIANYYSCPVLSNDSDMYIYNVEGGLVRLDKMTIGNNCVIAEVYHYQAFCEQFQFKDTSVRLIVPALVGNDFWLSNTENDNFQLLLEEELGPPDSHNHIIFQSVEFASLFDSLERFIDEIPNFPYLNGRQRTKLEQNCKHSVEIYNSHKRYRISDILDSTELRTSEGGPIPLWALRNYRRGRLSKMSACVLVLKKYALHTLIDDTTRKSSVLASLPIRRCVYGILGSDCVMEHYRVEQQLSCKEILSYKSVEGCPLPTLHDMPKLSASERESILYSVLHCDEGVFKALDGHWKLVLASTVFWCKNAEPPPHLVESLLLCFLICSGHSAPLRRQYTATTFFRNGPDWMPNLHWFAQWQSCYKDAINLDTVLMLPVPVTCPSQLYDGRLVMYFAMTRDSESLMRYLHVSIGLFCKLLEVVSPQLAKKWNWHGRQPRTTSYQPAEQRRHDWQQLRGCQRRSVEHRTDWQSHGQRPEQQSAEQAYNWRSTQKGEMERVGNWRRSRPEQRSAEQASSWRSESDDLKLHCGKSAQDPDWRSSEQDHGVIRQRRSEQPEKRLQHSDSSQQGAVRPTSGGKLRTQEFPSTGQSNKCDSQSHGAIDAAVKAEKKTSQGKPGLAQGRNSKSTSQEGACKQVATHKAKSTNPSSSRSDENQSKPSSIPVEPKPVPHQGGSNKRHLKHRLPPHQRPPLSFQKQGSKSKLTSTTVEVKPNASDPSQAKLEASSTQGQRMKGKPASNPPDHQQQGIRKTPTSGKHRPPSSAKRTSKPLIQAQKDTGTPSSGHSSTLSHGDDRSSLQTAGTREEGSKKSHSRYRHRKPLKVASAPAV